MNDLPGGEWARSGSSTGGSVSFPSLVRDPVSIVVSRSGIWSAIAVGKSAVGTWLLWSVNWFLWLLIRSRSFFNALLGAGLEDPTASEKKNAEYWSLVQMRITSTAGNCKISALDWIIFIIYIIYYSKPRSVFWFCVNTNLHFSLQMLQQYLKMNVLCVSGASLHLEQMFPARCFQLLAQRHVVCFLFPLWPFPPVWRLALGPGCLWTELAEARVPAGPPGHL